MREFILEIRDADGTRRFPLGGLECVRLGRSRQNDVCIEATGVSRNHAILVHSAGAWKLVDLKSSNATYVRGEPVHESELRPGDQIRIGAAFVFFLEEAAASPAPTPRPRASQAPKTKLSEAKDRAAHPIPGAPGVIPVDPL